MRIMIHNNIGNRFGTSHKKDSLNVSMEQNKGVTINELNITDGFAGKALCTFLRKL